MEEFSLKFVFANVVSVSGWRTEFGKGDDPKHWVLPANEEEGQQVSWATLSWECTRVLYYAQSKGFRFLILIFATEIKTEGFPFPCG